MSYNQSAEDTDASTAELPRLDDSVPATTINIAPLSKA